MQEGSDDLEILGVRFDSKITFENNLHSVSRATYQRLDILKSWLVFNDRSHTERRFLGFVMPVLEYSSTVWCVYAPLATRRCSQ